MNITPINFASKILFKNSTNNRISKTYNLPCDSVSFSGKKNRVQENYSVNAQKGISLGKKILKLTRSNSLSAENLNNLVNENSPVPIKIDDIKNDPIFAMGTFGKAIAHMLPGYNTDYQLSMANIYLGKFPSTAKEESDFVANLAHEYTHVLQRAEDKNYYGLLEYTTNAEELSMIARTAKTVMDKMGENCQLRLFNDERQVKAVLSSIISGKFDIEKSIGKIDFEHIIDSAANEIALYLGKSSDDMKAAITKWIKQETQNEIEAYSVTIAVLEHSKYDPIVKAKRQLSKDIYSYINASLN